MNKPLVREYTNDEELQKDVKDLKDRGVDKEDVYVLSHDDDRTKRVSDNAGANTIGLSEMDLNTAVGNIFNKKGDELRSKLQEVGFSEQEASRYEEKLDEGRILMMVTDYDKVSDWK